MFKKQYFNQLLGDKVFAERLNDESMIALFPARIIIQNSSEQRCAAISVPISLCRTWFIANQIDNDRYIYTVQNAKIWSNLLVRKFIVEIYSVERHSFCRILGELPETQ